MLSKNDASAWVAEHGEEFDAAIAPLAAEVRAPQDLEALVEQLLGEDIASMYVCEAASAQSIVHALSQTGATGTASVLVAGSAPESISCDKPRLLDSLEYPEHVRGLLESLLGDVFLVDSLEEGLGARAGSARARFATKDGIVVWPGAKITVRMGTAGEEGMLARERELDDLRAQLEASNEEQATVQIELERLQGDLERKRAMSLDLSRTHAQRAGAQASAQAERERLAKRVGTLQASQKSVAEDLARVNVELAKTEPEVVELGQAIEALRVSRTDAEERMSDISGARAIAYEREQSLSSKLSESKLEFATAKERSLSLTREHRERVRDLERANTRKSEQSATSWCSMSRASASSRCTTCCKT